MFDWETLRRIVRSGGVFLRRTRREADATPREVGRLGEELAARYLRGRGYRILARNYRFPGGEVDLVARRGGVISLVEVKTRRAGILLSSAPLETNRTRRAGGPGEALNARQIERLRRSVPYIAARWRVSGLPFRIDAFVVQLDRELAVVSTMWIEGVDL